MFPITYEADYEREPDRVTTFFRLILAIPWLIVGYVYLIVGFFSVLAAWFTLIFSGRYPEGLYNFNSGILRYLTRVNAYVSLQTDQFPPFGIGADPTYPVRLQIAPRAEKQSRLKVFFRIFLFIPAYVVQYLVSYLHMLVSVVSWLTIVFRGYQPAGAHNALTFTNGYLARAEGYLGLLTDTYPPVGAEGPQVGDTPPAAIAPSAPAPPAVAAPESQAPPPQAAPGQAPPDPGQAS